MVQDISSCFGGFRPAKKERNTAYTCSAGLHFCFLLALFITTPIKDSTGIHDIFKMVIEFDGCKKHPFSLFIRKIILDWCGDLPIHYIAF
ncbi:MAG TPA: hypothetical protein ENH35_02345 [Candidatus Moranbacteria bacterium]|nr:hypothetical protein [Candidatus Moranbacteria bacterium]